MQFRLTYRGELRSSQNRGRLQEIHLIRKHFHPQMKKLWSLAPLSGWADALLEANDPNKGVFRDLSVRLNRGSFSFCPLVGTKLALIAKLDIMMLRAAEPGRLYDAGDLDNRIKMLLDALRPPTLGEINSAGLLPAEDEVPFYSVLEDDAFITGLTVDTDYLLDAVTMSEVSLLISVNLGASKPMMMHTGLV